MTKLQQRRTKLRFETADEIRERGKFRAVVIEAHEIYCVVRLAGMRTGFPISYGSIYQFAAKNAATRVRAEKAAAKKAGRK